MFSIEIQKVVTVGTVDVNPSGKRSVLEAVFSMIGKDYDNAGASGNAEYRFPGPNGPMEVYLHDRSKSVGGSEFVD